MKQVKQFRFYGTNNENNYPTNLTYGELRVGNIFRNLGLVLHLGVQALPGTLFYLNNSPHPIGVGSTGIYELDLEGLSQISSIRFDKASLDRVDGSEGTQLIIDVLYEGAGK